MFSSTWAPRYTCLLYPSWPAACIYSCMHCHCSCTCMINFRSNWPRILQGCQAPPWFFCHWLIYHVNPIHKEILPIWMHTFKNVLASMEQIIMHHLSSLAASQLYKTWPIYTCSSNIFFINCVYSPSEQIETQQVFTIHHLHGYSFFRINNQEILLIWMHTLLTLSEVIWPPANTYLPTLPGIPGSLPGFYPTSRGPGDSLINPGNFHAVVCAIFWPQISAQCVAIVVQQYQFCVSYTSSAMCTVVQSPSRTACVLGCEGE